MPEPEKQSFWKELLWEYVIGPGIFLAYVAFWVVLAILLTDSDGAAVLVIILGAVLSVPLIFLVARVQRRRARRKD